MENIHTILSKYGISIPEDKRAEFDKALAENYKTSAEFEKKVSRLEAERDTQKERADTAEEALKSFEGIDPAKVNEQIADWKKKAEEAEQNAQKQLEERDFNDALKTALDGIKFTSTAARKAIEAEVRASCSKVKDGTIIGFTDVIASAKKADASAFVDEQQEEMEVQKPRFTQPNGGGNTGGGRKLSDMTLDERIKLKKSNPNLYESMKKENK